VDLHNLQSLFSTGIACTTETLGVAQHLRHYLATVLDVQTTVVLNGLTTFNLHLVTPSETSIQRTNHKTHVTASSEATLFQGAMSAILAKLSPTFVEPAHCSLTPETNQQILMIDIGRVYYSLPALKGLIDEMALLQFNYLQLHFSENEGFRIESSLHPEIMSTKFLTKADIRELILYAQTRYIEIIPDLDSPGHLGQVLQQYPEWQLLKQAEDGALNRDSEAFDILNPAAVAFIHSLYAEYAELFAGSRYFHIGADEFIDFDHVEHYPKLSRYAKEKYGDEASGIEVFIEYVNATIDYVRALGFIPRVWNDGFFRVNRTEKIHLSAHCEVSYWTRWNQNMAPVETFIEKNYQLVNHNQTYLYYALKPQAPFGYPNFERTFAHITPRLFPPNTLLPKQKASQLAGVAISIWSDRRQTKNELQVNHDIFFTMAALMQRNVGLTYGLEKEYQAIWKVLRVPKE
jgi:hexosaminidase